MEMSERTTTFMVLRRVSDGAFLRSAAGDCYRVENMWSADLNFAHQFRSRPGLTATLNKMRKPAPRWKLDYGTSAVDTGKVSIDFKAEEFQVEEVELKTTGRTVAF